MTTAVRHLGQHQHEGFACGKPLCNTQQRRTLATEQSHKFVVEPLGNGVERPEVMQLRPGIGVAGLFDGLFNHSLVGAQGKGVIGRPHFAGQITLEHPSKVATGLEA
ncbi:hypothetical protein D3C86_1829850 [compost metagenome]